MQPWERLATATAPDGEPLELKRRGREFRIFAGGLELMSNEDESSSRALASLGLAHVAGVKRPVRALVGGLGMGFTLAEALARVSARSTVEVAELVAAVVDWNASEWLGPLAGHPLKDPRTALHVGDVHARIRDAAPGRYDALLLDVDNGPIALAHADNDLLYGRRGIAACHRALRDDGVLAVWSLLDDPRYTKRLEQGGFHARAERVFGSRNGRGRQHVIWLATKRR